MLEELFKKDSLDENDLKIIHANIRNLSVEQLQRLGFVTTPEQKKEILQEIVTDVLNPAPKKRGRPSKLKS